MERGALAGEAPEDDPYRHFRAEVERALADAEAAEVALIAQAARGGDWRAAAWVLGHRFPQRWGGHEQRQRRDWTEGHDETTEARQLVDLDRAQFDREVEELVAKLKEPSPERPEPDNDRLGP